ncbi:Ran GTPase-activating protein 1 [Nematocida displodere]|uniref:Ran GTPase-activating protein 1 n=1 Tax=Nematocida displodere TaxID=1805483 RepID=A0A177EL38_9MICR|nr:Ran GTPase-activating protein 1 [Nematocida displodere]
MKILSISEEKKKYNTREELIDLLKQIEESRHELIGLDISENSFSPECILELVKAISAIPTMEIVTFKGVFTGRGKEEVEESLRHIAEYLRKLEGLTYFDISDNALSLHGMKLLSPLIEKMDSLRHLVLNNNGIGRDGGSYLAESLTVLSKSNNGLQSIEVGRNRLEDSAKAIGAALELFPYLDSVKIYQNSINAVIMSDFLLSLSVLSIRVLDIGDNFLLEHGSRALSKCLNHWSVEVLNISDCLMGDSGVTVLASQLAQNTRIQGELLGEIVFDLSYNDLTEDTFQHTQTLLEKLPAARFILTGNELSADHIETLSQIAAYKGGEVLFEEEEDLVFSSEEKEEPEEDLASLEEQLADIVLSHHTEPQTKEVG